MKKFFLLILVAAAFASCKNNKEAADAINTLSTDWEGVTKSSTEFANNLSAELKSWSAMMGEMNISEDVQKKMGEELTNRANTIKGACQGYGNVYNGLQKELTSFMSDWQTKSKDLAGLKSALTDGKLPADAMAQVASLTEAVTGAKSKMGDWGTKLAETQKLCAKSHADFKEVLASVVQ